MAREQEKAAAPFSQASAGHRLASRGSEVTFLSPQPVVVRDPPRNALSGRP